MNEAFQLIVKNLSIIGAVCSIIGTLLSLLLTIRAARNKLKKVKHTDFEAVLESNNISFLGKYLDETLGNFNIFEYSSNSRIALQVDKYLERIKNFVGTVDELEEGDKQPKPESEFYGINEEDLPDDFIPIIKELRTGESWNALARLRRLIEINLRQLATEDDFPEKTIRSAGYLLKSMEKKYDLNRNSTGLLGYAINICNKAVHGADISTGEAEEAIYTAARTLPDIMASIDNSRTRR